MTKQLVKTTSIVLFLCLFLSSCESCGPCPGGDCDPPPPPLSELIVGEWNINSFEWQDFEYMGTEFSEFTIEFGQIFRERGPVVGSLTETITNKVEVLDGEYRLNEFNEQIAHLALGFLPISLGMNVEYDIFLQGSDQLIMTGSIVFEDDVTIRATRISN